MLHSYVSCVAPRHVSLQIRAGACARLELDSIASHVRDVCAVPCFGNEPCIHKMSSFGELRSVLPVDDIPHRVSFQLRSLTSHHCVHHTSPMRTLPRKRSCCVGMCVASLMSFRMTLILSRRGVLCGAGMRVIVLSCCTSHVRLSCRASVIFMRLSLCNIR